MTLHISARYVATSLLALACALTAAVAGGPLNIFDPASRTPYAWPAGDTPVYLDMGSLGQLTNEEADSMVAASLAQWNAVPTASFHAVVAGDFASIGLPDITAENIFDVLGAWNGGGIHIVYDADGSIHNALLGYAGVLGFTLTEYLDDDSPAMLEAIIVLNGAWVSDAPTADIAMSSYGGVVTHEFGHAINLAHSQTNGQIYFFYEPYVGPEGCVDPYASVPNPGQIETMYPLINVWGTGPDVSTVDHLDDIAAFSDIYPDADWPDSHGTIAGSIRVPSVGPHGNEVTGVNVIARNVADPFSDAISGMSGAYTQGAAGADGRYTFHGLTPGASYVLYVDGIWAGAFSTPYPTVLPGPEEYYNGTLESGDGMKDDRCAYTAIPVAAGRSAIADVTFNRVKGAPVFHAIELPNSTVFDISGHGEVAVGTWAGGMFRWTPDSAIELIGGDFLTPSPGVSEDGHTIVGNILDETTFPEPVELAAVWQGGENWMPIGVVPGNEPCGTSLQSAWDVSNNGKVVGLSWRNCVDQSAFEWTKATGIHELGYLGDSERPASRADAITADGDTIVGWDKGPYGFWRGARWDRGVESLLLTNSPSRCATDPADPFYAWSNVGAAYGISANGRAIVGESYPVPRSYDLGDGTLVHYCDSGGWLWTPTRGVEWLGEFQYALDYAGTSAVDVSDDAEVVVGVALPSSPWGQPATLLWTRATGAIDFQEFLAVQGTWAPGWVLSGMSSISGDGHTIGGGAYSPYSIQGWVVEIPKVIVCHYTPATKKTPARRHTIDVAFPDALGAHLAHGDTIGLCGNGM